MVAFKSILATFSHSAIGMRRGVVVCGALAVLCLLSVVECGTKHDQLVHF